MFKTQNERFSLENNHTFFLIYQYFRIVVHEMTPINIFLFPLHLPILYGKTRSLKLQTHY